MMKLSEANKKNIIRNYDVMWDILSLKPHMLESNSIPKHIKIPPSLPSYSTLKLIKSKKQLTDATLRGLVDFFNLNISPAISEDTFLNTCISENDYFPIVSVKKSLSGFYANFMKTFLCVYPSENGKIYGGVLRLGDRDNEKNVAQFIDGFRYDETFNDDKLRKLLSKKTFHYTEYREYYDTLEFKDKRTYYFKGTHRIMEDCIYVDLYGKSHTTGKIARHMNLVINIRDFIKTYSKPNPYIGGMALTMKTCDGPYDPRAYFMGLANFEFVKHLSLNDPELQEILSNVPQNNRTVLTSAKNNLWLNYVYEHCEYSES